MTTVTLAGLEQRRAMLQAEITRREQALQTTQTTQTARRELAKLDRRIAQIRAQGYDNRRGRF